MLRMLTFWRGGLLLGSVAIVEGVGGLGREHAVNLRGLDGCKTGGVHRVTWLITVRGL